MCIYFWDSACILKGNDASERRHISGMAFQNNHQKLAYMFDSLSRLASKKMSKPTLLNLYEGIHWWSVDSPQEGPGTWKAFPCHDVVIRIQHKDTAIITRVTAILADIFFCKILKNAKGVIARGFDLWQLQVSQCESLSVSVYLLSKLSIGPEVAENAKTHFHIDVLISPKINLGHV